MIKKILLALAVVAGVSAAPLAAQANDMHVMHHHHHHHHHPVPHHHHHHHHMHTM